MPRLIRNAVVCGAMLSVILFTALLTLTWPNAQTNPLPGAIGDITYKNVTV